jgi:hypothetical protein
MPNRLPLAAAALAMAFLAACNPAKRTAHAQPLAVADVRAVVARTCQPAASPMCQCIVNETVQTLEAAPDALIAAFQDPGAVWEDAIAGLDPKKREDAARIRAAAEMKCRRTPRQASPRSASMTVLDDRVSRMARAWQMVLGACTSGGNERRVCECLATTLRTSLSEDAFMALRADIRFPPQLEGLSPNDKRLALATIGSARAVCGVE